MANGYRGRTRAAGGLRAGLLAGLVMALIAMVRSAAVGLGFWLPMKLVAATFWGVGVLIGGVGVVLVGALVHFAVAGAAGALLGWLAGNGLNEIGGLVLGLLYGAAIWAFNTWALLPQVDPIMLARQMTAPGWWLTFHLVFGGLLLFTAPFIHRAGARRRRSGRG